MHSDQWESFIALFPSQVRVGVYNKALLDNFFIIVIGIIINVTHYLGLRQFKKMFVVILLKLAVIKTRLGT